MERSVKFDCSERGPHWHRCYPGRADDVFNQEPAGFDAMIAFGETQLSGDTLPTMLREQSYAALATPERITAAQAAVPSSSPRCGRR